MARENPPAARAERKLKHDDLLRAPQPLLKHRPPGILYEKIPGKNFLKQPLPLGLRALAVARRVRAVRLVHDVVEVHAGHAGPRGKLPRKR